MGRGVGAVPAARPDSTPSTQRLTVLPFTPSTPRSPDDGPRTNTRRQPGRTGNRRDRRSPHGRPTGNWAFSGQSTQMLTSSRSARSAISSDAPSGIAGGWSNLSSPVRRNADSRSSAIVLATVLRRAASIFCVDYCLRFFGVVRLPSSALPLDAFLRFFSLRVLFCSGASRGVAVRAYFGFCGVSGAKVEN